MRAFLRGFGTKKELLFMSAGSLSLAVGVALFEIPNNFVTGGVSSVALVIAKYLPVFSPNVWIGVLNMLLLLLGFLVLGRGTGAKTV